MMLKINFDVELILDLEKFYLFKSLKTLGT